ncbi:hypothetical protein ACFL08_01050 [Patescibacteria group bacterium]
MTDSFDSAMAEVRRCCIVQMREIVEEEVYFEVIPCKENELCLGPKFTVKREGRRIIATEDIEGNVLMNNPEKLLKKAMEANRLFVYRPGVRVFVRRVANCESHLDNLFAG